jgi:DNA (cytosine-5)-methyltransferase 1
MSEIDGSSYTNAAIDLVVSGAPCQSWSHAGNRKGLDDRRGNVFIESIDIIHHLQPKIFMIENVKGLMTHANGESLKSLLAIFDARNKYNVVYKLLKAVDYQVP